MAPDRCAVVSFSAAHHFLNCWKVLAALWAMRQTRFQPNSALGIQNQLLVAINVIILDYNPVLLSCALILNWKPPVVAPTVSRGTHTLWIVIVDVWKRALVTEQGS